jgi:hypothetical protein
MSCGLVKPVNIAITAAIIAAISLFMHISPFQEKERSADPLFNFPYAFP